MRRLGDSITGKRTVNEHVLEEEEEGIERMRLRRPNFDENERTKKKKKKE